jgi:hypothetical protein
MRLTMKSILSLLRCHRANAAVEFALLAPIFFSMIFGIIEFGYQAWIKISLDYAVEQSARCSALKYTDGTAGTDCSTTSGTLAYFKVLTQGVPFPGGALSLTYPSSGCIQYSYQSTWLVPSMMPVTAPTFSNKACYYY